MTNIFCPRCGTQLIPVRGKDWSYECHNCGYKDYPNPIPVVAALLTLDNNVVIVSSRNKDLWGLPGGYIAHGENLEEAISREILEETGLRITESKYLASYSLEKDGLNILFIVFTAHVKGGNLEAGDDVKEVMVLPPEEALKQLTGKLAKRALETWMIKMEKGES